jgi:hypothetical protein
MCSPASRVGRKLDDTEKKIHLLLFQHIANPKADEWSKFVSTLTEMKQQAAEREEDSNLLGSAAPIR